MMTRLEQFFSCLGSADLEGAGRMIEADAEFVAVRPDRDARLPLYGTFRGAGGLAEFCHGLASAFETHAFEIADVVETASLAYASGRFHHVVRATGLPFASDFAVRLRYRDGLITHYQFYEDTARLETAFGLAGREGAQ